MTLQEVKDNPEQYSFQFSDRYIAKLSNTGPLGNTLVNVWDAIRTYGLVAEADWAYPRLQRQPVFTRDEYYKEVPAELILKGKKFLEIFEVKYEFVLPNRASLAKQLRQAPIQIAAAVCSGWNSDSPVVACGVKPAAHATTIFRIEDTATYDFDHYFPFRKKLSPDYYIPYALKGLLSIRKQGDMTPEAQNYLNTHQGKMILASPSGRIALVKGNEIQEAPVLPEDATIADRAARRTALMALIRQVGEDKGGISDALYDSFDKRPF